MIKKFAKVSAASLLSVLLILTSSTNISAQDHHDVKTDINVEVEKDTIVTPPTDPEGGGEEPDPKPEGELGFWAKPKALNFKGTYKATEGYVLSQTESNKEEQKRRLVVADVRANEKDWAVKAKLSDLSNDTETISGGFKLTAKAELGKFNVSNGAVNQTVIKDANGVKLTETGKITVKNDASSQIIFAKSAPTAEAVGKGYSVTDLKDFELVFESGKGKVGNDFKGTIDWTLSDTLQ